MKRPGIQLLLSLSLIALLSGPAAGQRRSIPIEGYAAVVNDRIIMVSDVMGPIQQHQRSLAATYKGKDLEQKMAGLYRDSLDRQVERALVLEQFEADEGVVPDRAIEDHMDSIIRTRFNDDRRELMNALSQEQLTLSEWRNQLKEELIFSIMRRQAVFDNISLSPTEVRAHYDANIETYHTPAQLRLHMISVSKGETRESIIEQASRIKTARERILAGESFETVARELSEDSKAEQGGDWGLRAPGDLRKELANLAASLPIGEISSAVVAGDNFYLVQVDERVEEMTVPFGEVQEGLTEELRGLEAERIHKEWIARLKKNHYVKIY